MLNISKTFCPAKWNEVLVNLGANYVYSCCKSIPIKITKKEDIAHALDQQKSNLFNGIQDASCEYCWKIENQGHKSLRHIYLEKFDDTTLDLYKNNQIKPKEIEINLGNECNFQCVYCNPKFSSQWESDVKNKSYKTYSDRYFYAIDEKNKNNISDTASWLSEIGYVENLRIVGGEPLHNKHFDKIINSITSDNIIVTTNLSKNANKILELSSKYKNVQLGISLDSTGENAEFNRYGMNYQQMLTNIDQIINAKPDNLEIKFLSNMTSLTIRDIENTINLINEYHNVNSEIKWLISYCRDPKIMSLATLPNNIKPEILNLLITLKNKLWISGVDVLIGAIKSTEFNQTLYGQLKYFLEEFSSRKKINIPVELSLPISKTKVD